MALALWAVLMGLGDFATPSLSYWAMPDNSLWPIPQMLLGIAMVMVMFENERNAVRKMRLRFRL